MKEHGLLSVKEASEILGLRPKTLYMWKWRKKHLVFIKVGRSLKISRSHLMSFIEKGKKHPNKEIN